MSSPTLFSRGPWPEARRVAAALRAETVGGSILLVATVLALLVANSPLHPLYERVRETHLGYAPWHLDLSVAHWASDGLLAIFFFVVGLELKHELTVGGLRNPRQAALPVAAAVCGVVVPAALYVAAVVLGGDPAAARGWATPTATDIAFALGVLAIVGQHLPTALRTFLLTLAVADDLIAIVIIAVFLSGSVHLLPLLASLATVGVFALLARRPGTDRAALLIPLALVAWAFMHASGVHATIAGVLLGLVIPVPRDEHGDRLPHVPGTRRALCDRAETRVHPVSAGLALPVFAFFAAGVRVVGSDVRGALTDPVLVGIVLGLVVGKVVGVLGGTWLFARFTRAQLDPDLAWRDVLGMSVLCGIGFTVALLVGELSLAGDEHAVEHARLGILLASALAALLGAAVLRGRNRVYREMEEAESRDDDGDGIPDAYQGARA